MFVREKLNSLNDYFSSYQQRSGKGVYFCRIVSYNPEVEEFLMHYFEEARKCNGYISGKINNPDERQLAFFEEIVGTDFVMDKAFISNSIKKWLPRISAIQNKDISEALFAVLDGMMKNGKNLNMLKNAYMKYMCWFYYKFEQTISNLGKNEPPKILYEGSISDYEIKALDILSKSGCDIMIVEIPISANKSNYKPYSSDVQLVSISGGKFFPAEYSLAKQINNRKNTVKIQTQRPQKTYSPNIQPEAKQQIGSIEDHKIMIETNYVMATNIWLSGDIWENSYKIQSDRGTEKTYIYNMFVRIRGVEDKEQYMKNLLKWKMKLEGLSRNVVIVEKKMPMPEVSEVNSIKRGTYSSPRQMLAFMVENINFPKCGELEKLLRKSFLELFLNINEPLNILTNKAVCLLCWIKRYVPKLFVSWKIYEYPVFVLYGGCTSENEALFLKMLSKTPVDIFVICPDLDMQCVLEDKFLFDKVYDESAPLGEFPKSVDEISFKTAAYNAERDLDTLMYNGTGLYRNRQFKRAIPVKIQTTYEEIGILWPQEAKYRPDFETLDDKVIVPVICSKVSGVPNGDRDKYWTYIAGLIDDETTVIKKAPFIKHNSPNPIKMHSASFLKNGVLQIEKIKLHPVYKYGFIREDMQDYMFDKLTKLLDSKLIKGTFENGTEYTIVSVALNLDMNILRAVQKFDFTKEIPKLLIINTTEALFSLEDSILAAYLSMLGFDILMFAPTGYQGVERFYNKPFFVEHQAGEYIYDMEVPDLEKTSDSMNKLGFINKIFKRR